MFNTSLDILYLVLSICAAVLTVFLCISLYQMMKFLRFTNQTLEEVKEKIERIASVFHFFRSKVVEEGMNAIVGFIKARSKTSKTSKTSEDGE